jgi:hypothetical protein
MEAPGRHDLICRIDPKMREVIYRSAKKYNRWAEIKLLSAYEKSRKEFPGKSHLSRL